MRRTLVLAAVLCSGAGGTRASSDVAVPLKPDPPPAIDGHLSEWTEIPAHALEGAGTIQLAWRPEHLYVALQLPGKRFAAEVIVGAARTRLSESPEGVRVAAERTPTGHAIEAAIPWRRLGIAPGHGARFEVAIAEPPGSRGWRRRCVLADTEGRATTPVAKELRLATGETAERRFALRSAGRGQELVLSLRARLDTPKPQGYTQALRVVLNGTALDADRLFDREPVQEIGTGDSIVMAAGDRFTVPYAPDFEAPDRDPEYRLRASGASTIAIRVTDVVRHGENVLRLENTGPAHLGYALVLGDIEIAERRRAEPDPRKAGAPKGELPLVEPSSRHAVDYRLEEGAGGDLIVEVASERFRIESRLSTPDGAWQTTSNRHFRLERRIDRRTEAIVVTDTLTNLTKERLPVMIRRSVAPAVRKLLLAELGGRRPAAATAQVSDPANPSVYAATERAGVGLLALDDVSQVHARAVRDAGALVLADPSLVLAPGARHVAEWAILPTAAADPFAFVNAARRLRDANFTVEGPFAFLRADPRSPVARWSDGQVQDFVRFKGARWLSTFSTDPPQGGAFTHGAAFARLDWSFLESELRRRRKLLPDVRMLVYFHAFIDATDEAERRHGEARLVRPDGGHADYGPPELKLYVPTEDNGFARALREHVEHILRAPPRGLGADGVYWDETEYSEARYHYGDFDRPGGLPWDGVSADIDPDTHRIRRLKSSVTLLSQRFRVSLAREILARGHALVGNGQPHTRSMAAVKFPRFVETGNLANLASAQLYSPVALGDHLTERSDLDAYRQMLRALDRGCLYYWYDDLRVVPSRPQLPRYMFPMTPIELRAGTVIGRERIVTSRSGRFGWGDAARHEVHVFDPGGREVPAFPSPAVVRDGKTYTELRLPPGHAAAVIRR